MRITELKLKKFKGFFDLDLHLGSQNLFVIIGENGAGKSSILEALNKLLSELDYNLNGNKRHILLNEDIQIDANETECFISLLMKQNSELKWSYSKSKEVNTKHTIKYYADDNKIDIKNGINKEKFIQQLEKNFGKIDITRRIPTYLYFKSDYIPNADDFIQWYKDLVLFESYLESSNSKFEFSLKEAIELAIKKFTGISITARIADDFKTIKPVFRHKGRDLDFSHLSDGEKRIIDIVGKIVSNFVISFQSNKKKLLEFSGIVLIDEIEKHLHPLWQRNILPELVKTFPNVQFIITSHSPQVISNISRENVIIINNFEIQKDIPHTLGRDTNSILYDIFKLSKRPEIYQKKINNIYELLDNEDINNAKTELNNLIFDLGENDIEIKRIQTQIDLME